MSGHRVATWWGPTTGVGDDAAVVGLLAKAAGVSEREADALLLAERRRYLLVSRLGKSSFAETWLAFDRVLLSRVVVKFIDRGGVAEARAVAVARHPHVIAILDFGRYEGQEYAVFDYCEGATLAAWSEGKPWRAIVSRILEAGRGLQYCHEHGLVHGDVKPANILIKQGRAVVADFGLAGEPGQPVVGGGTPGYIAPELARGERSPKADVYALAVTAWRCLFGAPPYPGNSAAAMVVAAFEGRPEQPEHVPEGFPSELGEVLVRGMHSDEARRPAMREWLRELEEAADLPRRAEARFRQVRNVAVLLAFAAVTGVASHSARGACVVEEQAPVLTEPSMERAIELADNREPLRAYVEYTRLIDAQIPMTAGEVMLLGESMIMVAAELPAHERDAVASLAEEIVTTAGVMGKTAGDQSMVERYERARDAARALSQSSRLSRPR